MCIRDRWKIDHDLNVALVGAAREAGARTFVFVSSGGTRGFTSRYVPYSRMKIGVEDAVRDAGFEHAIVLRPGIILGEREVPHQGGALLNGAVRGLGRWVGQGAQDRLGQDAEVIARAAVQAAKIAEEGKACLLYTSPSPRDS